MAEAAETVVHERHGRVLVIALRREHKRNAVDQDISDGIEAGLDLLESDPDLWAGVITGTTTVFSAGTDLAAGYAPKTERGGQYGVIRRPRTKPLIAAVEGLALGGGFEIVLACDLVVASRTAAFGLPEVRRGLLANCGAIFRAPRTLPVNVARELLLTGEPTDAARLYQLGVVNRLTEPGEALAGALATAEAICRNSPTAVSQTLQAVERAISADDELGWQATEDGFRTVVASADATEGLTAFLEKRPPEWTGR
ncbi:enoyl-CoA hydratase-related protein [Yinghuangia seranimata]|uniref:enoyl-CoA hydratase-related protein n=1 Tax=Yinghuangia seranimata TaxID=408067 RepID=UPI00248BFBD8|nr:enoyl-CoA hydratase-related protein [Yinghuangia seranimata]MDI2132334.1 enoyl-CoA hydratase-related protein [Yinghuangia seranimata]